MTVNRPLEIHRWSTFSVAERDRRDFYETSVSETLIPMRVVCDTPAPLNAATSFMDLGPVTLARLTGSKHRSLRGKAELSRSTGRSINLVINHRSTWRFFQRDRMLLRVGDAVLTDSLLPFELDHDSYDMVNLQISESWLQQWIPSPNLLVGRPIRHDVGWGAALSSFVSALSPEQIVRSPIPSHLFVDHIGGLIAHVAYEMNGRPRQPGPAERSLHRRVQDLLMQRGAEWWLAAEDVADDLHVPTVAMHHALGACGTTFGRMLADARLEMAMRMLVSPLMVRLTVAEIGRRAGFSDPSSFARFIRRRIGLPPSQVRPGGEGRRRASTAPPALSGGDRS